LTLDTPIRRALRRREHGLAREVRRSLARLDRLFLSF
jgi:hypothetical protein